MEIKIIKEKINREELEKIAQQEYVTLVKIAVDTKKEIIALGGEWHSECQEVLIENGSINKNIWGANVTVSAPKKDRVTFHSLINVKPHCGHQQMEIQNADIKEKITQIIDKLIE